MSRSNPTENVPNPSVRWFEWDGAKGNLRYYDKEEKANVAVDLPFEFVLLDRLSTLKGWHDASESGIYSNEIRDTRNEPFVVKAFKMKEHIADGFYSDIKDKVKASGGKFTVNCYVAFTNDEGYLSIGSVQFHGAALNAWFDFENRDDIRAMLYKSGIKITKAEEGKKGSIKFKVPVFELVALPPEVNEQATELDRKVQDYLRSYFKRTRTEQAQPATPEDEALETLREEKDKDEKEDDIPF